MKRRPVLVNLGQGVTVEFVLPTVQDLEGRLALLRQKEATLGDLTLDGLVVEKAQTEGFIINAANAIDTINAKLSELNNFIKIKSAELAVTAPTIIGYVKQCTCAFLCISHQCVEIPTPKVNPRIAEIYREIENLTREKTEWTSVLSRGMGIFQGLNSYVDKVTLEINARKALAAQIAETLTPIEEGVPVAIPEVIKKYLPMLLVGGIMAITLVRPKEKK